MLETSLLKNTALKTDKEKEIIMGFITFKTYKDRRVIQWVIKQKRIKNRSKSKQLDFNSQVFLILW